MPSKAGFPIAKVLFCSFLPALPFPLSFGWMFKRLEENPLQFIEEHRTTTWETQGP